MAEQMSVPCISMALDMKKHRIRIHKPTIHMLGDPSLIQLLFDPEAMIVAIVCPEAEVPGGQEIRIHSKNYKGDNCVEVYSKMFLQKLRGMHGGLQDDCTYRLIGEIIPELRAARFPMRTIQKIECEEEENGHGYAQCQNPDH